MRCVEIDDNLKLYNSYTNSYRADNSPQYKDFSEKSPFSVQSILSAVDSYDDRVDRDALYGVLHSYCKVIDADIKAVENVVRLKDKKTFAIITGHQPALFGGALFILLKIASVISLAAKLNLATSEYHFVPVFWNASEDHNTAEFGSLSLYDVSNDIHSVSINLEQELKMSSEIDAGVIDTVIDDVFTALPNSEFLEQIKKEVLGSQSSSLAESFSRLINTWFGRFGLVIIEPKYLRKLAVPIIADGLSCHKELFANMRVDSEMMLEKGFKTQLPFTDETNSFAFYLQDGKRYRIKVFADRFVVNDLGLDFSKEELISLLHQAPEKFSPVAALRPMVQSFIFPVPVYVAGGGELAYHYQLRSNFKALGQQIPLILPRITGSFITPSIGKLLKSFAIDIKDIFNGSLDWDRLESELAVASNELTSAFSKYRDGFNLLNKDFSHELNSLGVVNQNEIIREIEKYEKRFELLQKRLSAGTAFGGSGAKGRFYKLLKFLLPANKYQELSISGLYFYSLLGSDFFDKICEADVFSTKHKVWVFD